MFLNNSYPCGGILFGGSILPLLSRKAIPDGICYFLTVTFLILLFETSSVFKKNCLQTLYPAR